MDVFFLLFISILLGMCRIGGIKHIAYQAAAHLFVGGLIGAWLINWKRAYLYLAIGLAVLEVVCFVAFKYGWL